MATSSIPSGVSTSSYTRRTPSPIIRISLGSWSAVIFRKPLAAVIIPAVYLRSATISWIIREIPNIDRYVVHACRSQDFLIYTSHSFSDDTDIIRFLIRRIWNSDSSGKINEFNMCPGFFLQFLINILREYGCGCDCSSYTELKLSETIGAVGEDIMLITELQNRISSEILFDMFMCKQMILTIFIMGSRRRYYVFF